MARKSAITVALGSFLITSLFQPALAYQATTLPAPAPETRPIPLPQPLPETRPTPLPRPVPPATTRPTPNRPGHGGGFAGTIRCESRDNRTRRCNARTENRVQLIRRLSDRECRQGRSWRYDRNSITVSRGCRAEFAFGFGSHSGQPDRNRGPSTGAIIAGVAVAGGLIALLASSRNRNTPAQGTTPPTTPAPPTTFPPGPPAAISADFSALPADARPVAQTCMFEASRQIGVTGGTQLRYDRLVSLEPGNGGWRIRADLTATYPDGDRAMTIYCRATPTTIVELTFS